MMKRLKLILASVLVWLLTLVSFGWSEPMPPIQPSLFANALPIVSVDASGFNRDNTPDKTTDNNRKTGWSNKGAGSWIQYDLGEVKEIGWVALGFYKGSTREYSFIMGVSDDAVTWTDSGETLSTLNTKQLPYSLPAERGRYVRVTINGNSENDWGSITEGAVVAPAPTGPPVVATPIVLAPGVMKVFVPRGTKEVIIEVEK